MTREISRFVDKLRVEMSRYADASLRTPKNPTEFGYGEAVGHYRGLLRAEQLLKEAIAEETGDDEQK